MRFELNSNPKPAFLANMAWSIPGCEFVASINGGLFDHLNCQQIIGMCTEDVIDYCELYPTNYDGVADVNSASGIGMELWDNSSKASQNADCSHLTLAANGYSFTLFPNKGTHLSQYSSSNLESAKALFSNRRAYNGWFTPRWHCFANCCF